MSSLETNQCCVYIIIVIVLCCVHASLISHFVDTCIMFMVFDHNIKRLSVMFSKLCSSLCPVGHGPPSVRKEAGFQASLLGFVILYMSCCRNAIQE